MQLPYMSRKAGLLILPCGFGIYTHAALFATVICRYTIFSEMFTCIVKLSEIPRI